MQAPELAAVDVQKKFIFQEIAERVRINYEKIALQATAELIFKSTIDLLTESKFVKSSIYHNFAVGQKNFIAADHI